MRTLWYIASSFGFGEQGAESFRFKRFTKLCHHKNQYIHCLKNKWQSVKVLSGMCLYFYYKTSIKIDFKVLTMQNATSSRHTFCNVLPWASRATVLSVRSSTWLFCRLLYCSWLFMIFVQNVIWFVTSSTLSKCHHICLQSSFIYFLIIHKFLLRFYLVLSVTWFYFKSHVVSLFTSGFRDSFWLVRCILSYQLIGWLYNCTRVGTHALVLQHFSQTNEVNGE